MKPFKLNENLRLFLLVFFMIIFAVNGGRALVYLRDLAFGDANPIPQVDGFLILTLVILGVGIGLSIVYIALLAIRSLGGKYFTTYLKNGSLFDDLYTSKPDTRILYYIAFIWFIVYSAVAIVSKFL